jgi:spoIIIJ-associated protein
MNQQEIKKLIEEFFKKTGFEVFIEILPFQEKTIPVRIKTDEPKFLIGQNAKVLISLQRLLKLILKRKTGEDFYIDLDINDYKKKKIEYLEETAKSLADEVFLTKKEKILPPMPAYERRIIHLELSKRSDVLTESQGEGEERRVVIKPSNPHP